MVALPHLGIAHSRALQSINEARIRKFRDSKPTLVNIAVVLDDPALETSARRLAGWMPRYHEDGQIMASRHQMDLFSLERRLVFPTEKV